MHTPPTDTPKPYNACLQCVHRIKRRCDGPRTSGMSLSRWCEFMRDLKDAGKFTNADVAEGADVSIKTIERIMTMRCDQDIMRDTARRIENFLFGSSNQYPCYLAFEQSVPGAPEELNITLRELERAMADNNDYRNVLDGIHSAYAAEMKTIRDEAQAKIIYLRGLVDRLQRDNDYLWAENNRKSKIVDKFLQQIP